MHDDLSEVRLGFYTLIQSAKGGWRTGCTAGIPVFHGEITALHQSPCPLCRCSDDLCKMHKKETKRIKRRYQMEFQFQSSNLEQL